MEVREEFLYSHLKLLFENEMQDIKPCPRKVRERNERKEVIKRLCSNPDCAPCHNLMCSKCENLLSIGNEPPATCNACQVKKLLRIQYVLSYKIE
jgi:hypothetical protein